MRSLQAGTGACVRLHDNEARTQASLEGESCQSASMTTTVVPWSSSSTVCPPLASSAENGCCSSEVDLLWDDADLAERYLVCSLFEEAIALSTTLLRKLLVVWESSEQNVLVKMGDDEMESIMEAAGMVLIQSNAESGRTKVIFKDLETIFGCSAKVPSSVLLTGLCLQVSAGLFVEAQSFIESFLEHWVLKALNRQLCSYKPELGHQHKFFQLSSERYREIANVYCVQVLAKGLGRLDSALQWVKEADIPAEMKQDMHEKLEEVASTYDRKGEASAVTDRNMTQTSKPDFSEKSDLWVTEYVEARSRVAATKQVAKELDSYSSLKSIFLLNPVVSLFSGWTAPTEPCSDRVSRWKYMSRVVSENKLPFGGAAAVFLAIAVYRQRFQLSRLFGGLDMQLRHALRAVFISVYDFWQLAFSVQLNPLAAVQPLPSPHYRR